MNAPTFTPGPWHWHCSRTLMHLHDANGSCFAEVSMRRSLMHEADANLIAAAPELYAALDGLRTVMACHDSTPEEFLALANAVAALAKAVRS